ncbi:alpha-L-fucosidase [Saccharolobus shibatae]|uniref:Alpha-L-fucosidase n=1 Tax=Saccharolobus shibatae TaxID=2286 RepID=A0A8F5BYP4_9CREN|nr:alpha-L-fucosidase [Saccharolobus shibatae]
MRYIVKDYYPRQRHIYAIIFGKPKEITLRSFMKNLKLTEEGVIVDVTRLDGKGKLEWGLSDEGLKIKIEEVTRAPLVIRVILDYRLGSSA